MAICYMLWQMQLLLVEGSGRACYGGIMENFYIFSSLDIGTFIGDQSNYCWR